MERMNSYYRIQEKLCHVTRVTRETSELLAPFLTSIRVLDGWKGSLALQVLDTVG